MKAILLLILTAISLQCRAPNPKMADERYHDWNDWTMAIIMVESRGNDHAIGAMNDLGCLQITPILIKEANRILGKQKYRLNDAFNREKSIEIFNVVQGYWNPNKDKHLSLKIWNPRAPITYHKKVEKEFNLIQSRKSTFSVYNHK